MSVPVSVVDVEVLAVGRVLDEGRGSMPFALVHGEALVAAASWALSEARVLPLDARTDARSLVGTLRDEDLPLVLHDSLCPMTPPAFIAACVRRAVADDVVVVGVRPVTDTVKVLGTGGRLEPSGLDRLGRTVDREDLVKVVSPLVVPAGRLAGLGPGDEEGAAGHGADQAQGSLLERLSDPGADVVALLGLLRDGGPVVLVEAPPEAMRVSEPHDLRVLEALTRRAEPG